MIFIIEPTGRVIVDRKKQIATMRRRQIFEAAVKVISEKGFHEATISQIAREAGLGKGTIYHYIKRKEDLITLIAEQGIELMSEMIDAAESSCSTPEQKLMSIIDVKMGIMERHTLLGKTLAMEMRSIEPEQARRIEQLYEDKVLKTVAARIAELMPPDRRSEQDALILAFFLMDLSFLWTYSDLVRRQAGDIGNFKRVLTGLFVNGVNLGASGGGNG